MFIWDKEKNELLKKTRNISFEEISELLKNKDYIVDVVPNPKHEGEWVAILKVPGRYNLYIIPFLNLRNGDILLNTIFPSRKHTKDYKK